jgi:hypothetical protein
LSTSTGAALAMSGAAGMPVPMSIALSPLTSSVPVLSNALPAACAAAQRDRRVVHHDVAAR